MFYKDRNVLVLQGGRIFGRSLLERLLHQGAHVRATFEPPFEIDLKHKNLEVVKCDLFDREESEKIFKDIDIVFMTANKSAGAKIIKENPSLLFMNNIYLQPKLMQLAVKAQVQRVGFISSSYIYPETSEPNVEEEGFMGEPQKAIYGIGWCFRYLETLCKHFHMTTSTRFAIIRPAAYYGPYDQFDPDSAFVIPSLIMKAAKRESVIDIWGDGQDIRCFTYVDDMMEGLMAAVEKYAEAEGINICIKNSSTIKEVLLLILEILNVNPEVRFIADRPSTIPYKTSDPSRAKKILGWKARTDLKEGLGRTIDWYLKRKPTL